MQDIALDAPPLSDEQMMWFGELKKMLRGEKNLEQATLGSTRQRLAQALVMGRSGLDSRKEEVAEVIEQAVLALMREEAATEASGQEAGQCAPTDGLTPQD
eukprot:7407462-Karenia_brevis.AAC.1